MGQKTISPWSSYNCQCSDSF